MMILGISKKATPGLMINIDGVLLVNFNNGKLRASFLIVNI